MKYVFLDVETTGLNEKDNGIHQIAMIIEDENRVEVERHNFKVKPFVEDVIQEAALAVSGVTAEQIMGEDYIDPHTVHQLIKQIFGRHCDPFNRQDKMVFVAYNKRFDWKFMYSWFEKCGDSYWASYFDWDFSLCPMAMAKHHFGKEDVKDVFVKGGFKLGNVAKVCKLDVENIDWHDAMADISATRDVYHFLLDWEQANQATV